jgi:acyl homoserine lactone synthase
MMQLITQDHYGEFVEELAEMHRLRYRVFKRRLDWDVEVSGDLEVDEFDALHPAYLLQRSPSGRVQGCVRLLPSTGPTMLRETFSILLGGQSAPADPGVWRAAGLPSTWVTMLPARRAALPSRPTKLFIGMVEFGLASRLSAIVTVHRYPHGARAATRQLAIEAPRGALRHWRYPGRRRVPRDLAPGARPPEVR